METHDLSNADGCRRALAAETSAFIAAGPAGDVNRFRAVASALAILLQDFSRLATLELESVMADVEKRLDAWEDANATKQ